MNIKIIALDMDGTLMSPDHLTVTKRTIESLKKAHEKGIKLTIATGRTMSLLGNVLEQVPFIDYVICSNGACVYDRKNKKFIYTNTIDNKDALELLHFTDNMPVYPEVYIQGQDYGQDSKREFFPNEILPKEFIDYLVENGCIIPVDNIINYVGLSPVEKITYFSSDEKAIQTIMNKFNTDPRFTLSSAVGGDCELVKSGVTKGVALDGLCKSLGISSNETMSFGDAGNDIPMLEYCKYSFAMANGTEECKAAAKHITLSNGENGVAVAIEKYAL